LTVEIPVGCSGNIMLPDAVKEYKLNGVSVEKEKSKVFLQGGKYKISHNYHFR